MSHIQHAHRAVVPIGDPDSPFYGQKGDDPANDPPGWYTQPPECAYGQDFINTHGFVGCVPHNSPQHTLQKGAIALGALAAPIAAPIGAELRGMELTADGIGTLVRTQGDTIAAMARDLRTPEGVARFLSERAGEVAKDVVKDAARSAVHTAVRWLGAGKALQWASQHLFGVSKPEQADERR